MKYKFLNLNGLERFLNKVKSIIPTKTSELQNDSGFITAQGTYDSALSDTSEQAVQNKVIKQALDGKADDSSVVHNTGNETIEGSKTFTSDMPLKLKSSDVEISAIPSSSTNNAIRFTDKNNTIIADVKYSQYPSGNSEFGLNLRTKDTNNNTISKSVILNADQNGTWYQFRPSDNSEIGLGSSNYRWKSVYADNYYKGTTAFGDIITHNTSEFADASHTHMASDVFGLSTVATSGSYNDLSNKPAINDKTLTIKKNGTSLGTFTANSSTDETIDITVPTKTSDLTNDSGFLTSHNPVDSALSGTSVNAVQNKVVKSALDGKSDTGHTHTTSDITDLSIPSKVSDLTNDSGFITGVSWNDVSGKPSSFTPSSHSHGSITNDGKLGTAANKPLITGANGVITTGSFGTSANTFCQGNDSRLSDARTPLSHTHGNSDITSLDASKITSGTIDIARLPKGALERLVTVANQTARFALTSNDVQLGDTVKQLDTGVMYIVSDESKLSSADGYTEYTAGSATSVPWSGVQNKPSTYTPSSHTHGNITNDGKLGTASKVLISDSNKKITTSSVSDTELGYLSGVTSAIQTQISGKANTSHTHSASDITSGLATVATSGSYNDLSNKPTIPTVNNATLTIQKNGTTVKTFTANASSNVTANITVPTKTSELTNDSGFLTSHQSLANYLTKTTNVSEMGRYIDLHYDNATSKYDYDVRLYVDSQGTTAGGGSFKILAATAYAPAPAADANDTRIATTKWVTDKGYLTSHQSLSNYSTLANTIKSLSISGRTITYTKGDDTTGTLTTQDNNTWTAMVGATSSANGSVGYVNAVPPKDGYNTKYLRADGTWAVPPDHTYTVNNKTLTIQKNGTNVATFTSNSNTDVTANITVPTKTSDLTNDSHQTITVSTDTTSTASPAHSGTFTCIDSVTRDSNGHVTKVNTKTITLPSDNNTDTKVTQTATNSNAYYPVLVANTNIANTGTLPTTSTEGVRKSYSLSVNTRYGFLYGRNPYDTDNLKGAVAGGNRTSAAMYSLTYDNAVVGALELGRVDKYGNRYSRLYAVNYITDGALATDGTAISSVLDIGVLSNGLQYISTSGGWNCNVFPCTSNTRSLGTSDLKWSNVYATTFTGNLTGNVTGNVTGNCSGSSGSCTGNAATATKATGNANGKELTNTIIKGLSISGKTITYTQIDGTTGTLTTQDTNTDTLMTQNVSSTDAAYPLLLCPTANATANQGAKTGIFSSKARINASTGEIITDSQNGIRFRQSGESKYSSFIRNDGSSTYWMVTAANTPDGTYTSARPLTINNSTGVCSINGNAATATQFSANTTVALTGDATGTSSGSKKGWSVPVTLANSGVTAGTYGPSADVTGNNNATISVPQITVDAKGRVTSVVNKTLTCKNNTYTVNNATLTIQKNGTNVATFTSNASANATANITVPTKVSELTNDLKYSCSLSGNVINFDWSTQYANKVGIKVDNTWLGGILTTANTTIPTKTSQLTNDSGFLTSHQSLANYVTLNGTQTITGDKAFEGALKLNAYSWVIRYKTQGTSNYTNYDTFKQIEYNKFNNIITLRRSVDVLNSGDNFNVVDTSFAFYKIHVRSKYVDLVDNTRFLNDGTNNYVLPLVDNSTTFGSSTNRWKEAYAYTFRGTLANNGDTFAYTTAHALYFYSGQPAIANCSEGSSNDFTKFSYPTGATSVSSSNANIQSLRFVWDSTWWHEIFSSPNKEYLWHRNIMGGTAKGWRRIVEENVSGITDQTWNINIGGTSANVTGTVAIANGGTGATSRLNAVKNLTNENVGTGSQYFLTITTNWGKAGYCSVADAKTVLGVPTKTSQLTNDSGYLTSHQSLSNYVTLNGTQTISGAKTFSSNVTVNLGSSTDSGYNITANVSRKDVGDGKYYGTYINAGVSSGPGVLGVYGYIRNTDGTSELQMRLITSKSDGNYILKSLQFQADRYGDTWQFIPSANNTINLGTSSNKWKTAHAVNFYENGTKLSDKYQSLSDAKSVEIKVGETLLAGIRSDRVTSTNVSTGTKLQFQTSIINARALTVFEFVVGSGTSDLTLKVSETSNVPSSGGTYVWLGKTYSNITDVTGHQYYVGMVKRISI